VLAFTLRRLGSAIVLLLLVLSATFFFIHITPGEPALLYNNPRMSEAQRQHLRGVLGLDLPLGQRYVTWMGAMLRGDWGVSLSSGRPAAEMLLEKMPNTCILVAGTLVVEYSLGILLGVLAAARAGSRLDEWIRMTSLVLSATPFFWLALLAIELLSVRWPLFPTNQMTSDGAQLLPPLERALDVLRHLALPAVTSGLVRCGPVGRFIRNGLLDVKGQDYIRTAHAKGLSPARVLWVHGLRNAVIPVIQRFGFSLPLLLSGTLIVEVIFAWPGVGQTTYWAMLQRDYPVILASTALTGAMVVLGSLLADLLQALIDPRVRHA
jgi:peptide/nickel transport system permease protein